MGAEWHGGNRTIGVLRYLQYARKGSKRAAPSVTPDIPGSPHAVFASGCLHQQQGLRYNLLTSCATKRSVKDFALKAGGDGVIFPLFDYLPGSSCF